MRTLALTYCMIILLLAMILNIALSSRRGQARSSAVAAILNVFMIVSVIYLYNSGDSA